jgi:site-specific DNA recombinase
MTAGVDRDGNEGAAAVIYLRVSSKEQAEKGGEAEGYSIPAQREACKRKAASLRAAVVEEFVERGESAKTADRPELQRLLDFIREQPVKYVIVHKVDRLARSRADDVAINLAIHQAGAELVSVSENIDQTPSGLLLHGIMSSIAEFYSRNLATEVIKGSVQKAKNGGTPGRAPIGYLNVRRIVDGREVRTVELDPERAPLMAWAFEAYATGDWTIRRLLDELTERGLTTVPGKRGPGKPLEVSHLHRLLRHPYYIGVVRYRDVLYPGKHEALVTPEVWHEVQKLLSAKNYAGEKQRKHPHYLKGSVYCGQCGSRLVVCHARGRGGTYPYFICVGRQQKRSACKQRAIRIEQAEAAVAAYYATVQLSGQEVERLRVYLGEELAKLRSDAERERKEQRRRLGQLEGERKKLLEAHYADAVPLDLLKSEQDRLTAEIANAEGRLASIEGNFAAAEANLERILTRVGDCEAVYGEASGRTRRQFNLAFFTRLLLDDEGEVKAELAEPFATLLGEELRRAAVAQADVELREAVEEALRRRSAEGRLVGAKQHQNPVPFRGRGLNGINLVRPSGLEPPRTKWSTRPSTLRVYQFRHRRRVREYSPAQRAERLGMGGARGAARPPCLASVHSRRYSANKCSFQSTVHPNRESCRHGSDQAPAGDLRLHSQVLGEVRVPADRARHRQSRGAGVVVDRACAPRQPREARPASSRSVQAARDRAARPRGGKRRRHGARHRPPRQPPAARLGRRRSADAGGGEHRGLRVRPGDRRRRRRRVPAAHSRRLDEGSGDHRGRLRRGATAGHRARRRRRGGAARRGGDGQALLPRVRPRAPAAGERFDGADPQQRGHRARARRRAAQKRLSGTTAAASDGLGKG